MENNSEYEKYAEQLEREMEEKRKAEEVDGEEVNDDNEVEEPEIIEDYDQHAIMPTAVPEKVATFTDSATSRMQKDFLEGKRDVNETGKDIVHTLTLAKAVEENPDNEKFLEEIKKKKQEELSKSFENKKLDEEAKTYDAKRKKAEAFYKQFRPILEFDFSNLRKIQKKRIVKEGEKGNPRRTYTDRRGNEYEYVVETPKTYEDRSYGIPLMVLMLCILTIPYCVVTIVLSLFNAINEIFMQIANFGKPALYICATIFGIFILGVVVYVLLLVIQSSFGVTIFPESSAAVVNLATNLAYMLG